jgi:hypothetical protein
MLHYELTEQEKRAFDQEITKSWALDYFYAFNNIPLNFLYKDHLLKRELTELEQRNKAITEEIWLESYNLDIVCNVPFKYLYRPHALQLPLQAYQRGNGQPVPISEEDSEGRIYRTIDEVKAHFNAWMSKEGADLLEKLRKEPANEEWMILLGSPDRTMRLVSVLPLGNRIIAECIITWTENGVIKETAFAVILLYDIDGTILMDRTYCDMIGWPSSPGSKYRARAFKSGTAHQGQTKGALDTYLNRYNGRKVERKLDSMEKRNQQFTEGPWVNAYSTLDTRIFHPQRYRKQLPLQKISYKLNTSKQIESKIKEASPDRKIRTVNIYPAGNQVVTECIISWTESGIYKETPFISFLLFDQEGLIIRDRSYITLDHWPGSAQVAKELGIALD